MKFWMMAPRDIPIRVVKFSPATTLRKTFFLYITVPVTAFLSDRIVSCCTNDWQLSLTEP